MQILFRNSTGTRSCGKQRTYCALNIFELSICKYDHFNNTRQAILRVPLKIYKCTTLNKFISPPSTIYHWMTWLGFQYAPSKKGYYIDEHENPEEFNTDGISESDIWAMNKGCTDHGCRYQPRKQLSWMRTRVSKMSKLQERELSILGVAPRIITIWYSEEGKG